MEKEYQAGEALSVVRSIPFVQELQYRPTTERDTAEFDAKVDLRTPAGKVTLLAETRRSFLTRTDIDQLLAWTKQLSDHDQHRIILLARHISRPIAERLINAKINFADDAGNVHLAIGNRYNWTIVGLPGRERSPEARPVTAAQLRLLFQFAINPDSVTWPVRQLESVAGISKSKAAQARQELLTEGLLVRKGTRYQLGPADLLADRLISGYLQVLRPKLVVGRFRPPEPKSEAFIARLRSSVSSPVRYALTGVPAANILQGYYEAPEVQLFIEPSSREATKTLRLLPDANGPVTILQAFGEVVFWEKRQDQMLAPPWLIYVELLANRDPRAQEAAREFRREFLT